MTQPASPCLVTGPRPRPSPYPPFLRGFDGAGGGTESSNEDEDDADDALRDVECAKAACRDADALLAWLASDEALRSEDSERLQAWRASLDNCPVRVDLDTPSPRPSTALDPAWDAPSSAANRCRRALREAEVGRDEGRHREAALENDVFTGRHKTKTTPSAVLQAGWTRKWRDAQKVAEVFVEVFDNATANDNTINDSACMLLVRAARQLPDVGAYIGAHLVRSLLAVHDLTLPLDAWGPFTMSDDSVGQMRELLGDAVCSTPMQLRVALAQELGIAARCRWTAWVSNDERLELLNRARALVIPSLWEGFGLPALEAMACGTPVLASTAGALPEVVGSVAVPLDPTNPAQMSAAIDDFLQSTDLQQQLALQGPQRAAGFSWKQTGAELKQRLQSLCP